MVKVTIELDKKGQGTSRSIIAEAEICNDATGSEDSGNYVYSLSIPGKVLKSGRVTGYQRKRHSVWYLMWLILKDAYGRM